MKCFYIIIFVKDLIDFMFEIVKVIMELDILVFFIYIVYNDFSMEENIYWLEEVVC